MNRHHLNVPGPTSTPQPNRRGEIGRYQAEPCEASSPIHPMASLTVTDGSPGVLAIESALCVTRPRKPIRATACTIRCGTSTRTPSSVVTTIGTWSSSASRTIRSPTARPPTPSAAAVRRVRDAAAARRTTSTAGIVSTTRLRLGGKRPAPRLVPPARVYVRGQVRQQVGRRHGHVGLRPVRQAGGSPEPGTGSTPTARRRSSPRRWSEPDHCRRVKSEQPGEERLDVGSVRLSDQGTVDHGCQSARNARSASVSRRGYCRLRD